MSIYWTVLFLYLPLIVGVILLLINLKKTVTSTQFKKEFKQINKGYFIASLICMLVGMFLARDVPNVWPFLFLTWVFAYSSVSQHPPTVKKKKGNKKH